MTKTPPAQRALLLYQNLSGRAWVESEELNVESLAQESGVETFTKWVAERYQEVEVGKISEAFANFFKKLKRQQGQSIREFNSCFDRAHARLLEIECRLPETAKAWAYMNALSLAHGEELALLASVNNEYNTQRLQRAAVLHERSLKPPWMPRRPFFPDPKKNNGVKGAFMADIYEEEESEISVDLNDDGGVPEEIAVEIHEAYMSQEAAKSRYRDVMKSRGYATGDTRGNDQANLSASDRLKLAKSRSFCAGCKRRGHWHRDQECPLNQGKGGSAATSSATKGAAGNIEKNDNKPKDAFVVHVAYEVANSELGEDLLAITDCACSKTVVGQAWVQQYITLARRAGLAPCILPCHDEFRFGASDVFRANYAVSIAIAVQGKVFLVKAAVVNGDVPLLLSRTVLSRIGMIYNLAGHKADFSELGVSSYPLKVTATGHPAIPVAPHEMPGVVFPSPQEWGEDEIIMQREGRQQYMVHMTSAHVASEGTSSPNSFVETKTFVPGNVFYPKKIEPVVRNILLEEPFNPEVFLSWWTGTKHCNDFWIEGPHVWVRVHVIPRRSLFDPRKWRAPHPDQLAFLLEQLGCIRSTNSVACQHHLPMGDKHDFWSLPHEDALLPALWIGRTVFAKKPPIPHVRDIHGPGIALDMANEQAGVDSGGQRDGHHGAHIVDGARDQGSHLREAREDREEVASSQEAGKHDSGGASEHRQGAQDRVPSKCFEGSAGSADSLRDPVGRRAGGVLRPLQDLHVQRSAGVVPGVGPQGSQGEPRGIGRSEDVGGLVREQAREGRLSPSGPRGECDDALHPGRCKFLDVFFELEDDRESGATREGPSRLEPQRQRLQQALGTDAEETQHQQKGRQGLGRASEDGTGRANRGQGGDRGLDKEAGGDPRPVRHGPQVNDDVYEVITDYASIGAYITDRENMKQFVQRHDGELEATMEVVELDAAQFCQPEAKKEVEGLPEDAILDLNDYDPGSQQEVLYDLQFYNCYEEHEVTISELEAKAKRARIDKDFSQHTCAKIIRELCEKWGSEGQRQAMKTGKTVVLGAYSFSGFHGVTNRSHVFSEVTRYFNAYLKNAGAQGRWSSLSVALNTTPTLHRDSHNWAVEDNMIISLGDYVGGRLWVENDANGQDATENADVHTVSLPNGNKLTGTFMTTKDKLCYFDPSRRHYVEEWTGERMTITAYGVRGVPQLGREQRDLLRSFGFPLARKPKRHGGDLPTVTRDKETEVRPRKSTRKSLWKSAAHWTTMFTLAIFATATSFTSESLEDHKHFTAILEIGGYHKIAEAANLGFDVAEAYDYNDLYDHDTYHLLLDQMKELRPRVIWIHEQDGNERAHDRISSIGLLQADLGGITIIEGDSGSSLWNNAYLRDLQARCTSTIEDVAGRRVLRLHPRAHDNDAGSCANEVLAVSTSQRETGDKEPQRGAAAITFGAGVAPHVKAALSRLHQNLGHPAVSDLTRHLRLAGADAKVLKAAKTLRCQVCDRTKGTGSSRPAVLPSLLDFNQIVSVDVFHAFDSQRVRHEFISVIDHGTTYHLVKRIQGHSTESFEKDFVDVWARNFGAPGTIAADLETGLQAGLGRYVEFTGTRLRPAAGQAHWQQGVIERHGQWYQDILRRVIDEHSIDEDDIDIAVSMVNQAKNELRRRHGFSPTQAVYGKDPKTPEDLMAGNDEEHILDVMSYDRRRQREVAIRTAARVAFFRSQVDTRLRRSLLQRARVKRGEYTAGEMVCFYRIDKSATKRGRWRGPGVILGREGTNWWISCAGRCHLVAEEHMRPSTAEEVGGLFDTKMARADLEKLLFADPDDPDVYEGAHDGMEEEDGDADPTAPPAGHDDEHDFEFQLDGEEGDEPAKDEDMNAPGGEAPLSPGDVGGDGGAYGPGRRLRRKQRGSGSEPYSVNMLKKCVTEHSKEKQLEKELPWSQIPPEHYPDFKAAERKQIKEHIEHKALTILSRAESDVIRASVPGDRILTSRWAYKDKHYARRRLQPDVPCKAKARLVDPDIGLMPTDAPTVSRLGVHTLLQLVASHRGQQGGRRWSAAAGDVTAAFLNGPPLQRLLYLKQPRTGVEGMEEDALFRIDKGVFGLVDSPRTWWEEVRGILKKILVDYHGKTYALRQSTLDPCIFGLCEIENEKSVGRPQAYVAIHVDDLLVVGPEGLDEVFRKALSAKLPIDSWEVDDFEYIGSHVKVGDDGVSISQSAYAASRLFQIPIDKHQKDMDPATFEQCIDNRSLIGGLSWLAGQTRPDLLASVSLAQQMQQRPSVADIRFSNEASARALKHQDKGIHLYPLDLTSIQVVTFHDAAWANALPASLAGEEGFSLSPADHQLGFMTDVPEDYQIRKAKRASAHVASQYGLLVMMTDQDSRNGLKCSSILEWKSSTAKRICRSTFGAETLACTEGLELAQYVRSFVHSIIEGRIVKVEHLHGSGLPCLSDCKSLFDHIHKEGIPRTPTDKRLAIDLAALREALQSEQVHGRAQLHWLPTHLQFADVLTKPTCCDKWWNQVRSPLNLSFLKG